MAPQVQPKRRVRLIAGGCVARIPMYRSSPPPRGWCSSSYPSRQRDRRRASGWRWYLCPTGDHRPARDGCNRQMLERWWLLAFRPTAGCGGRDSCRALHERVRISDRTRREDQVRTPDKQVVVQRFLTNCDVRLRATVIHLHHPCTAHRGGLAQRSGLVHLVVKPVLLVAEQACDGEPRINPTSTIVSSSNL